MLIGSKSADQICLIFVKAAKQRRNLAPRAAKRNVGLMSIPKQKAVKRATVAGERLVCRPFHGLLFSNTNRPHAVRGAKFRRCYAAYTKSLLSYREQKRYILSSH